MLAIIVQRQLYEELVEHVDSKVAAVFATQDYVGYTYGIEYTSGQHQCLTVAMLTVMWPTTSGLHRPLIQTVGQVIVKF